jgi:mono/diheme cytochrome c family protein
MSRPRSIRLPLLFAVVLLVVCTAGCVRGCKSSRPPIHPNPNMDHQPRVDPQEGSDFFYDGRAMREPVPGTVARGELEENTAVFTGLDDQGQFLATNPLQITDRVRARGEQRYEIYCQPCHDKRGLGQGILYEYGNVPTASFHDEQRRGYPDGQIFDVITNGSGLMQGYRYPISAEDRWAIVAHVRRLQEERAASEIASAARP